MFEPDLLLSKEGRPIVVVEAKARPISPDFEPAVSRQLEAYSTEIGTRWALLVDPKNTRIFRLNQPIAVLSTEEILGQAFPIQPSIIGEQTLLIAVDRWLHDLPNHDDVLRRYPMLKEFASELVGAD